MEVTRARYCKDTETLLPGGEGEGDGGTKEKLVVKDSRSKGVKVQNEADQKAYRVSKEVEAENASVQTWQNRNSRNGGTEVRNSQESPGVPDLASMLMVASARYKEEVAVKEEEVVYKKEVAIVTEEEVEMLEMQLEEEKLAQARLVGMGEAVVRYGKRGPCHKDMVNHLRTMVDQALAKEAAGEAREVNRVKGHLKQGLEKEGGSESKHMIPVHEQDKPAPPGQVGRRAGGCNIHWENRVERKHEVKIMTELNTEMENLSKDISKINLKERKEEKKLNKYARGAPQTEPNMMTGDTSKHTYKVDLNQKGCQPGGEVKQMPKVLARDMRAGRVDPAGTARRDVCLRSIDSCYGDCEKKIERKVEKKIRKKRESSPELELNRVIEEITKQRDMNLKTRESEREAKVLEREEGGKERNLVKVLGRSPSPRSSPSPTKGFFMKESTTCPSLSFLPCPISKQLSTTTTTTTCSHSTMESPVEDAPTPGGSWEVAPLPPGFNQELGKFLKMAKFEAFKASNRNFADMSNTLG